MQIDFAATWEQGMSWDNYLSNEIHKHGDLWQAVYKRARIPDWASAEARQVTDGVKLLVLTEDWCGDAINTLPVLARLAEAASGLSLRVLKRDEHLHIIDQYLTNGLRSIPLAIILDGEFRPVGRWGPRPRELQEFVTREKAAGARSSAEIYRDVRAWYARDRGHTTLRELLDAVGSGAPAAPPSGT